MGLDARKTDLKFCWMLITKAQTSLLIWSAPLLFIMHSQLCSMQILNILASLCSWVGLFESYLVRNAKDRFSLIEAHISGGSRAGSGGSLEPPSPPPFLNPMKMK